ncbi:MAG: TonB-dependent receptor [Deltaproteobacteria bacterium]|nr:TonB-dependent receptor [Deltaproteobacteria bacterium]
MLKWLIGLCGAGFMLTPSSLLAQDSPPETTTEEPTEPSAQGSSVDASGSPTENSTSNITSSAGSTPRGLPTVSINIEDVSLEGLLKSVVASATKIGQSVSQAPSIVTVVLRDQVRDYGWISINDVLFKQPGFVPAQDYERPTVAGRGNFEGWNNNHILLLIDGVPFNDNLYGSAYTWEITPLILAHKIEMIRGPGSALYGSSAMNGVVAIETPKAKPNSPPAELQVRVGNGGTQIYDALVAQAFKPASIVMAGSFYSTDGNNYLSADDSWRTETGSTKLARNRTRDERMSHYFFGKVDAGGALRGLSLQLHNQYWKFETGHGWLFAIPDTPEDMRESRQMVALSYRPVSSGNYSQEYVARFQRHHIDWNMKYWPNFETNPNGYREYLRTNGNDIFLRAQLSRTLPDDANVLTGVEYTGFFYLGDEEHTTNFDLSDYETEPFYEPVAAGTKLGSWFAPVEDRLVNNVGVYAQLLSGSLLHQKLSITAGARYDIQWFDYKRPDGTVDAFTFRKFSPRLGLVAFPTETLSVKLLGGRAFRAPSPTEMFGSNTWTLATNIDKLTPETVDTIDFAVDWKVSDSLSFRPNVFWKHFQNQIAYSFDSGANASVNVYSQKTVGVETEVLWEKEMSDIGRLGGFVNFSFAKFLDETIKNDKTIAESDDLTWGPAYYGNLGMNYKLGKLGATVQAHYQGKVKRRATDLSPNEVNAYISSKRDLQYESYRDQDVAQWVSLNARVAYRVLPFMRLGCQGTNLLNSKGKTIKNNYYPFDYQIEPLRVMGTLELDWR